MGLNRDPLQASSGSVSLNLGASLQTPPTPSEEAQANREGDREGGREEAGQGVSEVCGETEDLPHYML